MDTNDFLVDVHALRELHDFRVRRLSELPAPRRDGVGMFVEAIRFPQALAHMELLADSLQKINVPVTPQHAALLRRVWLLEAVYSQAYQLVTRGEVDGKDAAEVHGKLVQIVSADLDSVLSAAKEAGGSAWGMVLLGSGLALGVLLVILLLKQDVPDEPLLEVPSVPRDEKLGWRMPYAPRMMRDASSCAVR
jgi:hypothetical protein